MGPGRAAPRFFFVFLFYLTCSHSVLALSLCCAMLKYFLCFNMLSLGPERSLITAPQWKRGSDSMAVYSETTRYKSGRQAHKSAQTQINGGHRHTCVRSAVLHYVLHMFHHAQAYQWWNEKTYVRRKDLTICDRHLTDLILLQGKLWNPPVQWDIIGPDASETTSSFPQPTEGTVRLKQSLMLKLI